jgi:hypothetical protein
MPFTVKEIQSTPNPNAAKFLLNRSVAAQPVSFFNAPAAQGHALAQKLFAIPGVCAVLLLDDFVTVNKAPGAKWPALKSKVCRVLERAD